MIEEHLDIQIGLVTPLALPCLDELVCTGIYFLYRSGAVVYVGQAVDIRRRLGQHIGDGLKRFDAVGYIKCPTSDLDRLEQRYIRRLAPEYNQCSLAKAVREMSGAEAADRCRNPVESSAVSSVEAAAILGVDVAGLKVLARDALFPRPRRSGPHRLRMYDRTELRAFLSAKAT